MYEKTYVLGVINKETVINTEEKVFTPTTSVQTYTPTSGTYISKVTVNAISTETKTVTPTASSQSVTPTSGKFLSSVTVNPIPTNYIIPSGTLTVTENGTHDVSIYANVEVNVESSGGGGGVAPGDDEYIDFVIIGSNSQRFAFDGLLVCSHSPVVVNANREVSVDGDYSGGLVYPQNSDCWGMPAVPFPDDGYYSIIFPANQSNVEIVRWKVPKNRPVDIELMGDTMGLPGQYECSNAQIIYSTPTVGWGDRLIIFWDVESVSNEVVLHTYDTGFNPA